MKIILVALSTCLLSLSALAEPIRIGWSGPLSGNSAVLGVDSVEAARLAVDEANAAGGINGRVLELIVEDDSYNTTKALSAYNKLTTRDGVVAILMSTYGGVFATAQRAAKDGVIIINPLDCNTDIARLPTNTFCIATESESIGRIIAEDIHRRKLLPVGVIFDESNPFMVLVERALREHLAEVGGTGYYSAGVWQDNADFKVILPRYRKAKVQSLVLFGHDPMGTAMAQARELGMKSQFYTVGTITSPGYQKLAGTAADGALVAFWEAPRTGAYQDFLKRFQAKVGRPPILELATIPTYDSTKILIAALKKAVSPSGELNISVMRDELYAVKDYPAISGTLSMDSDGAVRSIRERIFRFETGKLKEEV